MRSVIAMRSIVLRVCPTFVAVSRRYVCVVYYSVLTVCAVNTQIETERFLKGPEMLTIEGSFVSSNPFCCIYKQPFLFGKSFYHSLLLLVALLD